MVHDLYYFYVNPHCWNLKNAPFSIVKYLIEKGANLLLRNEDGQTPLDVAVRVWGFTLIFALFTALTFNFSFLFLGDG